MSKSPSPPPSSTTDRFWEAAFAGSTPLPALGLALKEGLIPVASLAEYGQQWFESWVTHQAARYVDSYDLAHRPWRQAGGAGRQSGHQLTDAGGGAPRLAHLPADHHDAGLVSLFEGFLARGVDVLGPFSNASPSLGASGLEAIVALNMPVLIDALAKQDNRPSAQHLQSFKTPGPVFGERTPLPWLHAAACGWQENLLMALLDYGLDPNQKDNKGQTPLFFARSAGAVKALLEAGADASLVDAQGRSAMQNWVQQKNNMPWPFDPKVLEKALGEVAKPATNNQGAAILYLTDSVKHFSDLKDEANEQLKGWAKKMPALDMPMNQARMNPGGGWKGEWSAAAWVGLQALQGELFYHNQVAWLIERPDFLNTTPVYPKGKGVSERGLLGLGLLNLLEYDAFYDPQDGRRGKWRQWNLKQTVRERFGQNWASEASWWEPMLETSRAIVGVKSTSKNLHDNVELAWRKYLCQVVKTGEVGALLWEIKDKGALRFELFEDSYNNESWLGLIEKSAAKDGDLANALYLLCIADLVHLHTRETKKYNPGAPMDFSYGNAARVLGYLRRNLQKHTGIRRLSAGLDAEFKVAYGALSAAGAVEGSGPASEVLASLRGYILEEKLPKPEAKTAARPRM